MLMSVEIKGELRVSDRVGQDGAGDGNRTSEATGARVGLVGRRLADQFKSIGDDQGMAFSGRCGPPQPFLVDLKRLRGCSLSTVSLFCPGGLASSQVITIPMQMCKIVVQRGISWRSSRIR